MYTTFEDVKLAARQVGKDWQRDYNNACSNTAERVGYIIGSVAVIIGFIHLVTLPFRVIRKLVK